MFKKRILALATALSLTSLSLIATPSANAADKIKPRVINGTTAPEGAYPWMVALLSSATQDSTEAHFCGGSLIAPEWVLTAAHCVSSYDYFSGQNIVASPIDIEVMIGKTTLPFAKGDRKSLKGIVVHPQFNGITLENDFALLKLNQAQPGPFLEIAGVGDASLYAEGTQAKVLGWGQTDPIYPVLPVKLQEGNVLENSDQTCLDTLGRWFKPDSMLCANKITGSTVVDACYGDSGGPLVVQTGSNLYKQVGAVSWGFDCANPQFRGIYGEVRTAEKFIKSFPTIAPFGLEPPTISGSTAIGSTLTCTPGKYVGDSVTKYTFSFFRESDSSPFLVQEGGTYVTTNADAGLAMYCAVRAENAGGSDIDLYSSNFIVVDSLPPPPPPPPVVVITPPLPDTTPPTSVVKSFTCTQPSTCELLVEASDNVSPDAVSKLEVIASRELELSCVKKDKKGKKISSVTCYKSSPELLDSYRIDSSTWSVVVARGSTRVNQKLRFAIRAIDSDGNKQQVATEFLKGMRKKAPVKKPPVKKTKTSSKK
jgi:secreted trypsin-like serine protease